MGTDNEGTGNALLAAALQYAARGWHVLPLRPRGKQPLTRHGCQEATVDAAAIVAWWRHAVRVTYRSMDRLAHLPRMERPGRARPW